MEVIELWQKCEGFERLSHLLSHVFALDISEGALVNMIKANCGAFARQAGRIRQDLFAKGAMESDETTMRVGKKNWWLWDATPTMIALAGRPARPQSAAAFPSPRSAATRQIIAKFNPLVIAAAKPALNRSHPTGSAGFCVATSICL